MEAAQFARRLRGSKAIRLGLANAPPQTLTSPSGFLQKDDYGLKQPLPAARRASPYIQVREMDSEWARPDWRPTTEDALFAKKWEERGLTAAPPSRAASATFVTSSHFVEGTVPDAEGLAKLAEQGKGKARQAPDFTWLSEADFEQYLDKLRDLQPEFAEYCRQREATPEASTSQLPADGDELAVAARTKRERGHLIVDFLNQHAQDLTNALPAKSKFHARQKELKAMPHPVLGLHYAPYSDVHNEQYAEPVPGRRLGKDVAGLDGHVGEGQARFLEDAAHVSKSIQTSFMGIIGTTPFENNRETGMVHWLSGDRDPKAGQGFYRLASGTAETNTKPRARDRRPAAYRPYAMETALDRMGGHRAVSREGSEREWEKHPGVPQNPISNLSLTPVDMKAELERAEPGSRKWAAGSDAFDNVWRDGSDSEDSTPRPRQELYSPKKPMLHFSSEPKEPSPPDDSLIEEHASESLTSRFTEQAKTRLSQEEELEDFETTPLAGQGDLPLAAADDDVSETSPEDYEEYLNWKRQKKSGTTPREPPEEKAVSPGPGPRVSQEDMQTHEELQRLLKETSERYK